jgi:hypothetical protein
VPIALTIALGFDAALNTIRAGRGLLYNTDVVDAFELIYLEQNYQEKWQSTEF